MRSIRWNLLTGHNLSPKRLSRRKSNSQVSLTIRRLLAEQLEPRRVFDATTAANVLSTYSSELDLNTAFESTSSASTGSASLYANSPDHVWGLRPRIPATQGQVSYIQPSSFSAVVLDRELLSSMLTSAPLEYSSDASRSPLEIMLPTPDHGFARFAVVLSPIMEPDLAAQFPEIQTFSGQGIDDPAATLRFDVTPAGFHAQVLSPSGAYYIDPYWHLDESVYISYFKKDLTLRAGREFIEEDINEHNAEPKLGMSSQGVDVESISKLPMQKDTASTGSKQLAPVLLPRSGTQLRTYRLANAATGEYTAFHGGTVALGQAAIVTAINRVDGIYESELSIRMVLVANNSVLVYTNAATDPYTNSNASSLLGQNQTNLDSVIGNANYDFGHVFSTGGGGLAGLGVVGVTGQKAQGETGLGAPIGDAFYVDYVAHEMGHQFGGDHSFNGITGSCAGGNRNGGTAYEPGSGSTIQAYAGICGSDDLQPNSDPYFHSVSFDEMVGYTTTGIGNSTASISLTGNNVPRVNAGADFVIPARTAFSLNAAGTDVDSGDVLTYNWEERDLGAAQAVGAADNGTSPIFRSFNPTISPERILPRLQDLLNNTTSIGEKLPTTNRTLKFRAIVRDNRSGGGGVNTDDMQISVVNTGSAFAVTSPDTNVSLNGNASETVTWNVAGTTAAPINTANVNIWLSTNGGISFPILLAANTPNDGSQAITVPDLTTTTARIKIEAANSIYFDVSNSNFSIVGSSNTAPTISNVLNRLINSSTSTGVIPFAIGDSQTAATDLVVTAISSNPALLPNSGIVLGGTGANRTISLSPALGQAGQAKISISVTDAGGLTAQSTFLLFVEGVIACVAYQDFDGVAPPVLPAGWTSSATGASATNWVTSNINSSSGPNNVFVSNPANVSDSRLTSPIIAVTQANSQFKFRNNYNLESSFDGGVLEIAINGGAFTDILSAGGGFKSGGYNGVISTGFSSPIAGRQAWTGNSGGYIDTVVEFPALAIGQNVQLQLRMGSDSSEVAVGWRADATQLCGIQVPTFLAIAATDASKLEGNSGNTPFTFTVSRTGDVTGSTSVSYAVTGSGSNPANAIDFGGVFPSGTLNFDPNVLNQLITVNVSGDTLLESNEGFAVTLSNPSGGATINAASAIGTILNDDSNQPPLINVSLSQVSGNVLTPIFNNGTWSDPELRNVTLSASVGVIVKNANGTWAWSITPSAVINNQTVTVTALDEDGGSASVTFSLSAIPAVSNKQVYYKGSSFASNGDTIPAALDPNKVIAKSGATEQTLSYANLINTTRGINGIVLDVAGLASSTLTASDFVLRVSPNGFFDEATNPPSSWEIAPVPIGIFVTPGTDSIPARVRLEWADNAIENRWLQIRVLANANTGLTTSEVYYLGHLRGEINGLTVGGAYFVNNADLTAALPVGQVALVGDTRDVDKNGFVLNADFILIRLGIINSLLLRNITIPPAGSAAEGEASSNRMNRMPSISSTSKSLNDEVHQQSLIDQLFTELGKDLDSKK